MKCPSPSSAESADNRSRAYNMGRNTENLVIAEAMVENGGLVSEERSSVTIRCVAEDGANATATIWSSLPRMWITTDPYKVQEIPLFTQDHSTHCVPTVIEEKRGFKAEGSDK